MRMFDGFCGRLGWAKAFLARGWKVTAVDLIAPSEIPPGVEFIQRDMLEIDAAFLRQFDFACFSSPCDGFACFSMRMWQPNPKYPAKEIELFNHTRAIAEQSGIPYLMENVRGAIEFVGAPTNRTGPWCLWGNAVPLLLPRGLRKSKWFKREGKPGNICLEALKGKRQRKAALASIPPELAACVADYAESLLQRKAIA